MRKVLSFVLVLSLVLGSFGMAFAATPAASDIAGKDCEDAVKVLTGLDVVSGYADGTYKPENVVTRAEMATLIVKALGLNDYAVGTPKFTDSKTHWAKGYIAYANSLGIISGRTATTFVPDAIVTYDEAATMLIKALGYSDDNLVGTWPTNYVTKAKVLGILDGVKSGTVGANRGDVAIMLYQTLDQAIGKVNKDGDWVGTATSFKENGDIATYDTMLARLGAKLYVPATYFDKKESNFVVIGDEDSVINLNPYKGSVVTAYMNDDEDIIAIKEVFSTFVSGTFGDAQDDLDTDTVFELADGTEYTLKQDAIDDIKGADAVRDIVTFKNGDNVKLSGNAVAADTQYTLSAKVSGKKITDIYAVSEWVVTDDFLFEKDMLEDDALNGHDFALDDSDEIDMDSYAIFGAATLADIAKDNVVYVYENKDEEITRIDVGTATLKGEVTKVNKDGDKITVDGKEYKYATENLTLSDADAKGADVGDEVNATLDYYGYIYQYNTNGNGGNYAVILETQDGEEGIRTGADAAVKLFLADGSSKTFDVDAEEISGSAIKDTKNGTWETAYKGKTPAGIIVEYSVDKDGVIDYFLPIDKTGGDYTLGNTSGVEKELTAKGYYNGKPIANDATIFVWDKDGAKSEADDYGITTVEKMTGKEFAADYTLKDGKIVIMLVSDDVTSDDIYGVVDNTFKSKDSSTDYMVTMLINGKATNYPIKKTPYEKAETNELFKLNLNASGEITGFESASKEKEVGVVTSWAIASKYNNKAIEVNGSTFSIPSDATVYLWNAKDEKFKSVSSVTKTNVEGNLVQLYDTDEDDTVDTVLIVEKADEDDVNVDLTAPTAKSATLDADGVTLKITFSEDVKNTDIANFTVEVKSVATTVSAVVAADDVVTLTLDTPVVSGSAVSVTYTKGTLADAAGNKVANFTKAVTNNSAL